MDSSAGEVYPVLPLRDIVVFPHMIVPLFVGREKSVRALEGVMKDDKQILLIAQKNAADDDPASEDIYTVGTISTVLQLLKLPDGTVKVLVEGGKRARVIRFSENEEYHEAYADFMPEVEKSEAELDALARSVVTQFEQYIKLNKKVPPEALVSVNQIDDPGKLADTVASHLALKIKEKQELLELGSVEERLERVISFMEGEIGVLQKERPAAGDRLEVVALARARRPLGRKVEHLSDAVELRVGGAHALEHLECRRFLGLHGIVVPPGGRPGNPGDGKELVFEGGR